MRWRDARLLSKRSTNCANCSTSTKGTADDRDIPHRRGLDESLELVSASHHAFPGLGAVAFCVAGNGSGGAGCGRDGGLPAPFGAVPGGCGRPGADVAVAGGDGVLLCPATSHCCRDREVVSAPRFRLAHDDGQNRGEWFDAARLCCRVPGSPCVA